MFPSQANRLTSNTNSCVCKVVRITEWQYACNMQCPVIDAMTVFFHHEMNPKDIGVTHKVYGCTLGTSYFRSYKMLM